MVPTSSPRHSIALFRRRLSRSRSQPRIGPLGVALGLAATLSACQEAPTAPEVGMIAPESSALASRAGGVVRVNVTAQDPGPPFYTRVSPYPEVFSQLFTDGRTVAIPVYRDPSCIPADFSLFQMYDPPSEAGPGAFGCQLLVGEDYLIEANVPFGTIPFHISVRGPAQIWFVDHDEFMARTADGILPWARLANEFTSVRVGTADHFNETHRPRQDPEHHVIISARGALADGGRFQFNVHHRGSQTQSISIRFQ